MVQVVQVGTEWFKRVETELRKAVSIVRQMAR